MKPVDDKDSAYINHNVESNDKDPTFEVGDRMIISIKKNIFAKGYTLN